MCAAFLSWQLDKMLLKSKPNLLQLKLILIHLHESSASDQLRQINYNISSAKGDIKQSHLKTPYDSLDSLSFQRWLVAGYNSQSAVGSVCRKVSLYKR